MCWFHHDPDLRAVPQNPIQQNPYSGCVCVSASLSVQGVLTKGSKFDSVRLMSWTCLMWMCLLWLNKLRSGEHESLMLDRSYREHTCTRSCHFIRNTQLKPSHGNQSVIKELMLRFCSNCFREVLIQIGERLESFDSGFRVRNTHRTGGKWLDGLVRNVLH